MRNATKNGTSQGFTLLELVVVLAIMTMLMALLWPNFERMLVNERLSSAMYQLHSDLRLAQATAQERQESVVVALYAHSDGGCYYIMRTISAEHGNMGTRLKSVDLPVGVRVNFACATEVECLGDGRIRQNGHVILMTQDQQSYLYFYQTGRMRITNEPN